jgi:YggT family protein
MLALISLALSLFVLVLFARGILSWIPNKTGVLRSIDDVVFRLTEPVLAPVRRVIPPMGGIDVSFIVVIVAIYIVRAVFLR